MRVWLGMVTVEVASDMEIGDLGRANGIGCQGERKGKDQE